MGNKSCPLGTQYATLTIAELLGMCRTVFAFGGGNGVLAGGDMGGLGTV